MIPPEHLKVETWPPRERGGQHVGITATGVKVEHLPTGITVIVCTERSQFRNREIALDMILAGVTHPKMRG